MMRLVTTVLLLTALPAAASWQPPAPRENAWDWIRLVSGEWLGGTLELMRDRDLEFDSEELGLLQLDWSDVEELRSPRILTYRFEPGGTVTGPAVIRGGRVTVDTGTGDRVLPRPALVLIMEGHLRERNFWSAKVSLGFVARSGNSSQTDLNSYLRVRRLTPRNRGLLTYTGNYGRIEQTENINNHNLSAGFDILMNAGFFVTPLQVNLQRDPFQNIDLKTTVGAGFGYDIMRDGDVDWTVGLGGGFQDTRYVSVETDGDARQSNASLTFSTDVAWDLTGDVEMVLGYNLQMGVPETSRTFHHGRVAFSLDLLGDVFDLDLGLIWDRVESPQANADGEMPERDDFRSTIGIGLEI